MFRIILLLTYIILFTCSCNPDKDVLESTNNDLQVLLKNVIQSDSSARIRLILDAINLVNINFEIPDSLRVKTYYLAGNIYHEAGNLDTSAIYFHKAISYINDSIQGDQDVWAFRKAHQAYQSLGAYEECAAISTKFASLIDMDTDSRNKATYYGFREEYFKSNPFKYIDSILKYNELGIKILQLSNEKTQVDNLLATRASHISHYKEDYTRSSEIFDELISREDELLKDTKRLLYNDYGIQKYYQQDFRSAIKFYKKGLSFVDDTVDKRNRLAGGYGNIAEAYLQINDFKNAGLYLDSLRSLKESGIEERFLFFLRNLELEYDFKKEKNIQKTISSIQNYSTELKNIHAKKYKSDLITLEQTLASRKEALEESNSLKLESINQKWNILILAFLLFGISIFGYFFYRQKSMKFELQQMLLHQRLLRSQMNPHFTYNFLAIIQSLIKDNQEKATQYLLKFSRLLRMILDNSTQNYVELSTEMEILSKKLNFNQ